MIPENFVIQFLDNFVHCKSPKLAAITCIEIHVPSWLASFKKIFFICQSLLTIKLGSKGSGYLELQLYKPFSPHKVNT